MPVERVKISGHGGFWVVPNAGFDPDAAEPGAENLVQHNAEYEVTYEADLREVRTAGCRGWAEGLHKAKRVTAAFFRVPDTDVLYPQALGFDVGHTLDTVWLKRGAADEYDRLDGTVVKSVRLTNDQKKVRWLEVTCQSGRLTRDVDAPELPSDDEDDPEEEP